MKRSHFAVLGALVLVLPLLAGVAPASATSTGWGFGTVTGGYDRPIAHVTAVRVARHATFDRLVIQFDGGRVPHFKVTPKSSSVFWLDPSDRRVVLLGRVGLKIVLPSATGQSTYLGPRDLRPRFPQLREARLIGDFEAVTTWGLGLHRTTAKRVLVLRSPARLVVDVHH
jgi:hypothetical protein